MIFDHYLNLKNNFIHKLPLSSQIKNLLLNNTFIHNNSLKNDKKLN